MYCVVCLFTSQRWSQYQIILLGDRGTCVWTTCLRSLRGSVAVRSRICASEIPQDCKSDTLLLDYRATHCNTLSRIVIIVIHCNNAICNSCMDNCDNMVMLNQDAEMAIAGMNGQWLGGRSLRTNWATGKGGGSTQRMQSSQCLCFYT